MNSAERQVVVIGGSDAGVSAALRIRELDHAANVTILLKDDFPNWSVCGLPYYLSGETPDWRELAHRTEFDGIDILRRHVAKRIDPVAQTVAVAASTDTERLLSYSSLIIATGAAPVQPDIPGMDLPRVHMLHTMGDALQVNRLLEDDPPSRSALIVGAGYIGLEMAEALVHRGLDVTVVSRAGTVFPTVDTPFGVAIGEELQRNGVTLVTDCTIEAIERAKDRQRLQIRGSRDFHDVADLVLVATGVQPESHLAAKAGAKLGTRGAIQVDRAMCTNVPNILAAGDCAETWHRILRCPAYIPLGTTAHKQGRVAGETALGGNRLFAGSVGTQIVKLFELSIARTGLLKREAISAGFDPATVEMEAWDHKAYYPGARKLRLRIMGDRRTGQLLGAQILGPWGAEISKRIDIFAAALFHGMAVAELNDLDLSYAPPFSSPWDPVQMVAQNWVARRA
ncbi:FAD-dependent oxidoreductase [Acidiphilium acidophilum]|uniref:FAD-dependent oxidoreductase n=1 Tax=Acidiphilium acidophilum TaxID=76588 RepID=UPI002E8E7496|nr:FAD-dependent oxidoreductase [Acidiphilium acidophilum]